MPYSSVKLSSSTKTNRDPFRPSLFIQYPNDQSVFRRTTALTKNMYPGYGFAPIQVINFLRAFPDRFTRSQFYYHCICDPRTSFTHLYNPLIMSPDNFYLSAEDNSFITEANRDGPTTFILPGMLHHWSFDSGHSSFYIYPDQKVWPRIAAFFGKVLEVHNFFINSTDGALELSTYTQHEANPHEASSHEFMLYFNSGLEPTEHGTSNTKQINMMMNAPSPSL